MAIHSRRERVVCSAILLLILPVLSACQSPGGGETSEGAEEDFPTEA
nr:hypothetical protein [Nocardioidaceae bacterium]